MAKQQKPESKSHGEAASPDQQATSAIRDADRTKHADTGEHAKDKKAEHVDASLDSHALTPPKR